MADPAQELARLLAAMAVTPQLDGLLLLDALSETLRTASHRLSELLRVADGREPRTLLLGAQLTDDELWSRMVVREDDDGYKRLWPAPGFLVQRDEDPVVLVVIPDLARLSVAARRSLVGLLDSPAAYLERHGQHRSWRPRLKWVAGCESAAVGDVSRHILDRFAVRFTAGRLVGADLIGARGRGSTRCPPSPPRPAPVRISTSRPRRPSAGSSRSADWPVPSRNWTGPPRSPPGTWTRPPV